MNPNRSPIAPGTGWKKRTGVPGAALTVSPPRRAAIVLGPATASTWSPEAAVEPAGLEAACVKEELERRDIPAALALAQRAVTEIRLAALPQGGPGLRPGDPVRREAVLRLEGADRILRPRPADPVDRMRIEPDGVHRHLEGRDVGAARARHGRQREERRPD